MSKRRLSQRQKQRIQMLQDSRPNEQGLVIAHCGRQEIDVECKDGEIYRCHVRQNLTGLVAGDQVMWKKTASDRGVITAQIPRTSAIVRPDAYGKLKPIAANVDRMVIVLSTDPPPATGLLDSYLVAAEHLKIQPIIVFNKIDLLRCHSREGGNPALNTLASFYEALGYPVLMTSVLQPQGLTILSDYLVDHMSVFVGQSGVGKSALLSCLLPHADIRVQAVSSVNEHGQHTTTTARLYHLREGGYVIDSPGIREFGLWNLSTAEIIRGFVEFQPFLGQCKFRNCQHQQDLGCALQQAIQAGVISPARLASYQQLIKRTTR